MASSDKSLWFRAKNFGWGWYPCSWQGWAVILLYVIGMFGNGIRIDGASHSIGDTLRPFLLQTLVLTVFLIVICYKTGEKPEWRWGGKKKTT